MERTGQILILAVSIYTVLGADPTLRVEGPSNPVQVGTDVELFCYVKDQNVYEQTTNWYRLDNADDKNSKELSSHNKLSGDIPGDKFEIHSEFNKETEEALYKLTIKGVEKFDDGNYRCAVVNPTTDDQLTENKVEVRIPQPISSLTLTVGSERFDSGENLNEVDLEVFDPDMPIICKAEGSNPQPEMKITIGGVNVTPQFGREDSASSIGNSILKSVRKYDTDLDSTAKYKLSKDQAGKPIVCEAWVDELQDAPLSVKAQLKLKVPPVAICRNRTTRLGDKRFEISCTITSSPKVSSPIWRVNGPDELVKVPTTDSEVKGYTGSKKDVNDTTIEVTLSIYQVEEKHFATTFFLEAETGAQPIDHAVRIHENPRSGGSTGGQGRVLMPTAVLLCVVMAGAVLKRLL